MPLTLQTRFRTKIFLGSVAASSIALIAAALLVSWQVQERQRADIERRLTEQARAVAGSLSAGWTDAAALDREADRIGGLLATRVTFIAADGRVVGESTQSRAALAAMENHGTRPEVVAARSDGLGVSARYSTTAGLDMLYVAARVSHPTVAYVRLALPATQVAAAPETVRTLTFVALAVAIPVTLLASWILSAPLARRVRAIAAIANRYAAGDLSRPAYDYGSDELGDVSRALDVSVQELGRRLEELSRDRARTEAILAGMSEGVLVVDTQGRLQLVNRAAQRMLRVDAAAIGRPYVEVIRHPDIAEQLATVLDGAEIESRELALTRDPGRTFVARAAPVTGPGGGAVLVLHDITDLRRADQIRRDFVANVSHELRTPLTAIRGYIEALQDEPGQSEDARRFLEIIGRQGARMDRLVNDLLRLARLDARQEVLELARCETRQIFQAVVADLTPSIYAKGQRVAIDVPPEACEAHADAAKLHDIVRNLVENAVNYSPEGAELRLAAARAGETLQLTVEDSGPGIPDADLTRVFERFYRVDKSRSRPGGTGLGLAIVKHLVELHDGSVSVVNRPDGGAMFTVTLPAAPADAHDDRPSPAAARER